MAALGSTEGRPAAGRRITAVLLTGVIALAFVGYVVGTAESRSASSRLGAAPVPAPCGPAPTPVSAHSIAPADVQRSVTYAEMRRGRTGPNHGFSTRLANLAQPTVDLFTVAAPAIEARLVSLRDRESRRAYNGAPPVIPHTVDQVSAASCLACHEHGLRVSERSASKIPHPFLTNCTQCHVEQDSASLEHFTLAANSFAGKPAPTEGPRAWPGAPPMIPHSTLMRSDCLACHGPGGPAGMQSTHPWRQSCTQCHAPSATLDQYASSEQPPLLPALPIAGP